MNITPILQSIGLTEKEAKVYAAILELGTATVLKISQKAELKRPTTYLVVNDLQRKGLVSMVPDSKTTLFTAESPELLAKDIYKKDELLKRYLPDLLAVHNQKKEKPQVQLFQGKKGMTEVYEKIYSSGEVWFYGTLGDLTRTFPSVTKEVSRRSRERRLKVREILSGTPEDLHYAKSITQNDFYNLRISPEGLNFFTDNAIFGNSVAFFSFNVQFFVVIITSKEIVEPLKSLYNMAWQVAKPIT